MNPQDPLAALQPLRAPEAIHWWPPAPGWWLLTGLLIVATSAAFVGYRRRRRRNAYRREAQRQLAVIRADFNAHRDPARYLAELNTLLKAVALCSYPQQSLAPLHSDRWRDFLNNQLPQEKAFAEVLSSGPYAAQVPAIDIDALDRSARYWVTHHEAAHA